MGKHTVSFRLDSDKVNALDTLADAQDRDRTYLLNEAVAAYLAVQKWQMEQIKKSLRQAQCHCRLPHSSPLAPKNFDAGESVKAKILPSDTSPRQTPQLRHKPWSAPLPEEGTRSGSAWCRAFVRSRSRGQP